MENNEGIYVTTQTSTQELLRLYPECAEVFDRHDMPCYECLALGCDTIADCALMHEIDAELLVKELQEFLDSLKTKGQPPRP